MYVFNPSDPSGTSKSVCLKECPTITGAANATNAICDYGINPAVGNITALFVSGDCAPIVIKSNSVLNRCIPALSEIPPELFQTMSLFKMNIAGATIDPGYILSQGQEIGVKVFADLQKTVPFLIGGIFASMIVCFVWIFLMRWFAGIIAWLSILGANVLMIGLSVWLYFFWKQREVAYNAKTVKNELDEVEYKGTMAAFIISSVLAGILLLITIGIRKRINIAIEIIKVSSKTISSMPMLCKLLP